MGGVTECVCGAEVTERFARVFGDRENNVFACPHCSTKDDYMNGGAANPEPGGTQRSWRPGEDEPRPAALHETDAGPTMDLAELPSKGVSPPKAGVSREVESENKADQAFQALVAE